LLGLPLSAHIVEPGHPLDALPGFQVKENIPTNYSTLIVIEKEKKTPFGNIFSPLCCVRRANLRFPVRCQIILVLGYGVLVRSPSFAASVFPRSGHDVHPATFRLQGAKIFFSMLVV
jgi:hypothetical protein